MENGLIVIFGFTMLYFAATGRLAAHIRLLVWQGLLLFLICCTEIHKLHPGSFIFLTLETLGVKAILIPWFLTRILKKHSMLRDEAPGKPHFFSLLIASLVLLAGILSQNWIQSYPIISPIHFGVSVSSIIICLWLITVKHNIVSSIIGFIAMENGIFLLSLSIAKEMPLLVNAGVLFEVFLDIFILGMFVNLIEKEFKNLDVSKLSELKDSGND